MYERTNDPKT